MVGIRGHRSAMAAGSSKTLPNRPTRAGVVAMYRRLHEAPHFIVLGEAHLRRILKPYARYYNETRTHLALDKDAPVSRPVQRTGVVRSLAILGGLHHHYLRV